MCSLKRTEQRGALTTITDPSVAVSTKWDESLGAVVLDEATICTVYAGPHNLVFEGDIMWMSGM